MIATIWILYACLYTDLILKWQHFDSFLFYVARLFYKDDNQSQSHKITTLWSIYKKGKKHIKAKRDHILQTLHQIWVIVNILLNSLCMKIFICGIIASIYFHHGTMAEFSVVRGVWKECLPISSPWNKQVARVCLHVKVKSNVLSFTNAWFLNGAVICSVRLCYW